MQKIKNLIIILIILISIPTKIFSVDLDDEYEELDYVWLEEEIEKAKKQEEPKIDSKCAVIFDRASKTVIWGKNENIKVSMASTTKIMTT